MNTAFIALPKRFLLSFAFASAIAPLSNAWAEWELYTQVDRMTDRSATFAVLKNPQGQQLWVFRRANLNAKGGTYWTIEANFMLAENDPNGIDPMLGPNGFNGPFMRMRVDNNDAHNFYATDLLVDRVTPRAALGLHISRFSSAKDCVSDDVYELARGSNMLVEYQTYGGGVRYAEFKLGNGETVISQAIRKDLSDKAVEQVCRSLAAAERTCIKRALSSAKGPSCEKVLYACAEKAETVEMFSACAARYLK